MLSLSQATWRMIGGEREKQRDRGHVLEREWLIGEVVMSFVPGLVKLLLAALCGEDYRFNSSFFNKQYDSSGKRERENNFDSCFYLREKIRDVEGDVGPTKKTKMWVQVNCCHVVVFEADTVLFGAAYQ